MNLISVSLSNFLSHKLTHVDFPEGLVGLIGLNGSGKSALVKESVTWALWGKSRVSGAGDALIHYKEKSCTAIVKFEVNEKVYKVTRTRLLNKSTNLSVERLDENDATGKELSKSTARETQEVINSLLGMTYDTFRNSCCIEQGEADSFSKLAPKEAADIILSILQLNMYDTYKQECICKCLEAKQEQEKLTVACEYLTTKFHELSNIKQIQKEKTTELNKMQSEYKKVHVEHAKNEKKCNKDQRELNSSMLVLRDLDVKYKEVDKRIASLSKHVAVLDKINGSCPICKTAIDESNKNTIKENLRKQYQDLLDETISIKNKRKTEAEKFNAIDAPSRQLNKVLKEQKIKISNLFSDISRLEGEISGLKTSSQELKDITTKLADHKAKLATLEDTEEIYSNLSSAFGHKGIPLLIIDNLIKELEVLVNENLELLSDLPISVRFITQRESTTGDLTDTFRIMLEEGLETRSYFNYSGGERMIIDLAIRLGLSALLARRNNFKVETLIIDEGLGSLDEGKQYDFIKTLKLLTKRFKRIILITHTEAKQYLNCCIELTKEDNISVVNA